MKKAILFTWPLFIMLLVVGSAGTLHANFIAGVHPVAIHSLSKSSIGIYRTPASNENKEIFFEESIVYGSTIFNGSWGVFFEAQAKPGHAGIRLMPMFYNSSLALNSKNFSSNVYNLIGYDTDQSLRLEQSGASKVTIEESGLGTALIFKYNLPVDFKASSGFLQVTQKVLQTANLWLGAGPMLMTFNRRLIAQSSTEEIASKKATDFFFLIGGGFNAEPHIAWAGFPAGIIISFDFLSSVNLTPGDAHSTADDNLVIEQSGIMINLGVGYKI